MTLGQKLASYRKLAGLTQQQLGEHLNISAQAISKWEKDLTEPAISTLRALADLYKVSVDVLLDLNAPLSVPVVFDEEPEFEVESLNTQKSEAPPPPATIGFCHRCGILVTQENVGTTQPAVACQNCLAAMQAEQQRAAEQQRRQQQQAEANRRFQLEQNRQKRRSTRTKSFWVAGIITAIFLFFMILGMTSGFSVGLLFTALIGSYVVFAFVACLFYDCLVQDVVCDWISKSFHAPGLIFTFDLDGCLWLIGMKLLFWALGLLFSLVAGAIGILCGLVLAPFVFPYVMHKEHVGIQNGAAAE